MRFTPRTSLRSFNTVRFAQPVSQILYLVSAVSDFGEKILACTFCQYDKLTQKYRIERLLTPTKEVKYFWHTHFGLGRAHHALPYLIPGMLWQVFAWVWCGAQSAWVWYGNIWRVQMVWYGKIWIVQGVWYGKIWIIQSYRGYGKIWRVHT